jgi:hypothetical protein
MPARIEVVGRRFGRLVVQSNLPLVPGVRRKVRCICDCGKVRIVDPRELLKGHTKSCGCLHREIVSEVSSARVTHGQAGSDIYNIWIHVRMRCDNPSDPKFPNYGGRGISVCREWSESFEKFASDMGPRPSKDHSIERIDVNGNYCKQNCRWATRMEQARNKRHHRLVELHGKLMPLSQACEEAGVNYRSALYRINNGKPWRFLPASPSVNSDNQAGAE